MKHLFEIVMATFLLAATASAQMGPSLVEATPVETGKLTLTAPLVATVEAVTQTTLAAQTEGLVRERSFEEGDLIDPQTSLARLDTDLLTIRKRAAQAAAQGKEAELLQAKQDVPRFERERARVGRLFEQGVAPEKEYLDAQTGFSNAQAQVAVKEAELAELQATAAELSEMINRADIKTPFAGKVDERFVEVGQWVKVGDPIARVVKLDPLYVRVNVPEATIRYIKKGQEAEVRIPALGETRMATVEQILPTAAMGSRTVTVRLSLPNPNGDVLPGFFAEVTSTRLADNETPIVPADAIVRTDRGTVVYIARDGKAVMVPVQTVLFIGGMTAVTPMGGELKAGDMVITRGNEGLHPGADIRMADTRGAGAPGGGGPPGGGAGGGGPGGPPADGQAPPQGDAPSDEKSAP